MILGLWTHMYNSLLAIEFNEAVMAILWNVLNLKWLFSLTLRQPLLKKTIC